MADRHTSSTVLATSFVSDVVIVWIFMGWSLPRATFPIITVLVFLRTVWLIDSQYFCLGTGKRTNAQWNLNIRIIVKWHNLHTKQRVNLRGRFELNCFRPRAWTLNYWSLIHPPGLNSPCKIHDLLEPWCDSAVACFNTRKSRRNNTQRHLPN